MTEPAKQTSVALVPQVIKANACTMHMIENMLKVARLVQNNLYDVLLLLPFSLLLK